MTDTQEKRPHGTYAEFDAVDTLLAACRRVRDAGYTKTDAFTPFPVHGIDKALGIKPTALPWIVLACGMTGAIVGLTMQVWMNSYNYPYIISGKPFFSIPAFIPVSFELTILFASFGAFFGMLALNRLPRFSNPLFTSPRFDRVTDDKFFLYIDASDARFDRGGVARLLEDVGGRHVQDVYDDDSSSKIPRAVFVTLGVLAFASLVPLLLVARMRVTTSPNPRFHVFFEMDFSPAKGPQMVSTSFADGRSMRPDVPGTVAVGQFDEEPNFYTGVDMEELARRDGDRATQLVRATFNQQDAPGDAGAGPSGADQDQDTPWLTENPLPISLALMERGRMQFEIYCATCHGNDGRGNGLVNRRAQRILATAWVQPSSLHQDTLDQDVYPDGKLFSVISNGIRKMGGYGAQIGVRDRWAVVAYVRALQQSQNASLEELPLDKRNELSRLKADVERRLAEQAEAERRRAEAAAQPGTEPLQPAEATATPAPTTQPEPAPTDQPAPAPADDPAPAAEPTASDQPEPTQQAQPQPAPATEPEPAPPSDPAAELSAPTPADEPQPDDNR
jgi:mono/diheme cytochrome c family protein